jgi:hypothetical protein
MFQLPFEDLFQIFIASIFWKYQIWNQSYFA